MNTEEAEKLFYETTSLAFREDVEAYHGLTKEKMVNILLKTSIDNPRFDKNEFEYQITLINDNFFLFVISNNIIQHTEKLNAYGQ